MREYSLSNCEKGFIQKAVAEGYRLDGRNYNESRKLQISFGNDYGSCLVSLGETKVLGQVSCEVVQPKQIRPNEGILYINVEISPMAAQHFEANRQTDLSVYLNRLLEKCYKDSKCIDLESLCIVVEEKVWSLRVDIKVLNHEGNIIECASIATLAALAHFRRPDVTRSGDNTIIHTIAEKDPIPTVLYHYPICLTFAIFGNSIVVSDPSFMEELVCTSSTEEGLNTGGVLLVIGMNQYREICLMDLTGSAIFNANLVHKATLNAANRCKDVVDMIKQSIASDNNLRQKRDKINFSKIITDNHVLSLSKKELNIQLRNYEHEDVNMGDSDAEMEKLEEEINEEFSKYSVLSTKPQTAETVSTTQGTKWVEVSSDSED